MKYWSFIDERKILEKLLADPSDINFDTKIKIKILIKYYKNKGMTKNDIRNELDRFLMEHCVKFCYAEWDDLLRRYVNKYTKAEHCELKKTNDIIIYKEELDFISSEWNIEGIKSIEIEKLLFIMLVLAKSSGDGTWLSYNDKIVFDLARYKFNKNINREIQKGKVFYELGHCDKKVLECMLYSQSGSIKLLYGKKEGEEVIRVRNDENIDNIIVKYLDWRQKPNYNYCKVCGKEIKKTNNRGKYCRKCAKEINIEKTKENKSKKSKFD